MKSDRRGRLLGYRASGTLHSSWAHTFYCQQLYWVSLASCRVAGQCRLRRFVCQLPRLRLRQAPWDEDRSSQHGYYRRRTDGCVSHCARRGSIALRRLRHACTSGLHDAGGRLLAPDGLFRVDNRAIVTRLKTAPLAPHRHLYHRLALGLFRQRLPRRLSARLIGVSRSLTSQWACRFRSTEHRKRSCKIYDHQCEPRWYGELYALALLSIPVGEPTFAKVC